MLGIKFGRLDAVVNCAALGITAKTYDFKKDRPHSMSVFAHLMNVNLIGTFNVIRLAVGLIGRNEPCADGLRGCVINTASILAFDGSVGTAAYAASKGGVVGMTLPVARDLAKQGIRCNTIAPGPFDTPMVSSIPQEARNQLAKLIPCPSRFGYPEEFAQLVESILLNPMVNGSVVRLDGGLRMEQWLTHGLKL